jgi:hypothetical protein
MRKRTIDEIKKREFLKMSEFLNHYLRHNLIKGNFEMKNLFLEKQINL